MEYIYSSETSQLLHIVLRRKDIKPGRKDIISKDQFLQCAALNLSKGTTFKPHKHIWKAGLSPVIAQESWVVISGSVKCLFYDLDGTPLGEYVLHAGDASFTLEGGHTYEILEEKTEVLEFKTGPYRGRGGDKIFL